MATIQIQGPPTGVLRFRQRVELDGTFFRILQFWSRRTRAWMMDFDSDGGVALVRGTRLSLGSDKFKGFKHLPVPQGSLNVVNLEGQDTEANVDDLGIRVAVQYVEVS